MSDPIVTPYLRPAPRTEAGARSRRRGEPPAGLGRTIGPVSDLERHLPADWWRTLFNSLYLKTDGDVVENDINTIQDIDLLVRMTGIEPNDRILDLCCGQGRHCLELARRGYRNVEGVDRSRYLVRLAKRRAKQMGMNVSFHEGDARRFRLPADSFHCVAILGNSFGYFEREDDDVAVLQAVLRVLRPGGLLALDLADGEWVRANFETRSWEWIDENHFVCRERSLARDEARLISREVIVHAERGVIADQFYAERLYTAGHISDLLDRVGFEAIRHHGTVESDSARNQDLGMMAHRMLVSAQARRRSIARPKAHQPRFPQVAVILGDPRLPDDLKRDGHFNPEDLETVRRLKAALGELEQYSFRYLDNHASLLSELRSDPPAFVLNLCDEGYNNDAFLELHVPATLEMMGIPYSGAGPACLGLCYNKSLVRAIAESLEVPVPAETYFDPTDQAATIPGSLPALVKPNFGDASLGITKDAVVQTPEELVSYINGLREQLPGRPILVQEFLTGPEYSVAILGNPGIGFRALPLVEVDYSSLDPSLPQILGYESKWEPDSPYWTDIDYRQASLDDDLQRQLIDHSTLLFERLGCRDYARFDYRTGSDGVIKLLEANPNPGWCWDGKFNFMAQFDGLRYADLLLKIIEVAQNRIVMNESVPASSAG